MADAAVSEAIAPAMTMTTANSSHVHLASVRRMITSQTGNPPYSVRKLMTGLD